MFRVRFRFSFHPRSRKFSENDWQIRDFRVARNIAVRDSIAYVADGDFGMLVLDVSDPELPDSIGFWNLGGPPYDIVVGEARSCSVRRFRRFVASYAQGLRIASIETPSTPVWVGWAKPSRDAAECRFTRVGIDGRHVFVSDANYGLMIFDIDSGHYNPMDLIGECRTPGIIHASAVLGELVYIADGDRGVQVADISNRTMPRLFCRYDTHSHSWSVAVDGDRAVVADRGFLHNQNGLHHLDVSEPVLPSFTALYPGGSNSGYNGEVGIRGHYLYCADPYTGFGIINIDSLAAGADDIPDTAVNDQTTVLTAFELCGNYAYLVSSWYGFIPLDISDPINPTGTNNGSYGASNHMHIEVAGDHAFIASNVSGLQVVDISEPTTPALVPGANHYTPAARGVTLHGDHAFVADLTNGLNVFAVYERQVEPLERLAVSSTVVTTERHIVRAVLSTEQEDSIAWELNVRGGDEASWEHVIPGEIDGLSGKPVVFDSTGTDLVWRANLYKVKPTPPSCDSLIIDYWFDCPIIDDVVDIPEDQGGWTRVYFSRSGYDFPDVDLPVDDYFVWRLADVDTFVAKSNTDGLLTRDDKSLPQHSPKPNQLAAMQGRYDTYVQDGRFYLMSTESDSDGFPEGAWEAVGRIAALQQDSLVVAVPTLLDQNTNTILPYDPWYTYVVSAHRTDPNLWYVSPLKSGFSVDDVAPDPVESMTATAVPGGGLRLSWDPCQADDFNEYRLYRGESDDFVPSEATHVNSTTETFWDRHKSTVPVSLQSHGGRLRGNESEPAVAEVSEIPFIPDRFALHNSVPNPFNPVTTITYDVPPGGGVVTIRVFDVAGRQVKTLVNENQYVGRKTVKWYGKNDHGDQVATGVYFYRMQAPGYVKTMKMTLLK